MPVRERTNRHARDAPKREGLARTVDQSINRLFKDCALRHGQPRGTIILPAFATTLLLPLLLASTPDAAAKRRAGAEAPVQLAQVTIEQRVIIRIPTMREGQASVMREGAPLPPPEVRLKEVKGPKCLQLNRLRGAVINPASGVTMVTLLREQFRAHFSRSCRPAEFYAGFYIEPNKDGALCARRDTLHSRNGSTCEIEKFSRLVPDDDDDD